MKNKYIYLVVYNELNFEDPDDDFKEIIYVTTDYQTALQFADRYAEHEEEHENSNNQMSDKEEKLGIVIIVIWSIAVVVTLTFLIVQAS